MAESQRKNTESQRKMPDRKNVIKGLMGLHGSKETMDIIFDAITLLREREPEIVRCKDCKHYDPDTQSCNNGLDGIFLPDWFCADGERR